jgi:hypothetical protein
MQGFAGGGNRRAGLQPDYYVQPVHRQNSIAGICVVAVPPGRCPFLAFSVQQRAANNSKRWHERTLKMAGFFE